MARTPFPAVAKKSAEGIRFLKQETVLTHKIPKLDLGSFQRANPSSRSIRERRRGRCALPPIASDPKR